MPKLGSLCSVGSCRSNAVQNINDPSSHHVRYYAFPKNAYVRNVWIERCGRHGNWNPETSRVCSLHFSEDDYERDIQAELLNLPPKRILKKEAVPSLNLSDMESMPSGSNNSGVPLQHSNQLPVTDWHQNTGGDLMLGMKNETHEAFEQQTSQQQQQQQQQQPHSQRQSSKGNVPRVWQLCRMCAGTGENMISIFSDEGREQQLAVKMKQHLLISVSADDCLPLRVCSRCMSELDSCHQLAFRCAQADATLRCLLQEEDEQGLAGWDSGDDNREEQNWSTDTSLATMAQVWLSEHAQNAATNQAQSSEQPALVTSVDEIQKTSEAKCPPLTIDMSRMRRTRGKSLQESSNPPPQSNESNCRVLQMLEWKKLLCWDCGSTLRGMNAFVSHQKEAHSREELPCHECGSLHNSLEQLMRHWKDEHPQISQQMSNQDPTQDNTSVLKSKRKAGVPKKASIPSPSIRKERKTSAPKTRSEMTDEMLDDLENVPLRERLRSKEHRKIPTFECKLCSSDFERRSSLREHLEAEHDRFECRVCEQLFCSPDEAQKHAQGPHEISCPQCQELFPTQRSLKSHTVQMHYEGKRPFVCSECGNHFISKITLRAHMKTHDGKRTTICDICGKGFRTYDALKQHKFTHMTDEEKKNIGFSCTMCDKKFSRRTKLEYHMRRHTDERHFTCAICSKSFHDSVRLKAHMERHSTDKKFKCDECGSGFVCKRYLTNHKSRYHRRREVIRCSVCKNVYNSAEEAMTHYKTHSAEEIAQSGTTDPYTQTYDHHCRQCCEYFPSKEQLDAHRATSHVRGRSHKTTLTPLDMAELIRQLDCTICGKKLWGAGSLKRHMSTHAGTRPERTFQCEFCAKMFAQKAQLVVHIRTHTGERPHRCSYCGKGFITGQSLVKHERIHTGETPFHCNQCPKAFRSKENLILHQKTHLGLKPYECHFCHKRFGRQIHLQLHLRTHTGERPYVCDICGRAFAQGGDMRRHRLTHTGERAYKCEMCGFSSNKRKTLREHEAAAHGHQSRVPPPGVPGMPPSINMGVGGALVARPAPPAPNMVPAVPQHMVPTPSQYAALQVQVQDPRMFLAAELHKNWSEN